MKSVVKTCSAFSLVELMIVVAILGILAAIVFPEFQGHTQRAKEAAAKDNLRTFREAIQRYSIEHNDVAPGYQNNDPSTIPTNLFLISQLVGKERYMKEIPNNPFNNKHNIMIILHNESFPLSPVLTNTTGWIYQPATCTIRLNWPGIDSEGVKYYDY